MLTIHIQIFITNHSFQIANCFDCETSLWIFLRFRLGESTKRMRKKKITLPLKIQKTARGWRKIRVQEKRTIKCNLKVELLWIGKLDVDGVKKEKEPTTQFFSLLVLNGFIFLWHFIGFGRHLKESRFSHTQKKKNLI